MFKAGIVSKSAGGGGGGDVTPNPTPNWADISFSNGQFPIVAVQQIQGITSTINLEVSRSLGGFAMYYKIDTSAPSWTNGGVILDISFSGWTQIISFPAVINVSNNQYISFGCSGLTTTSATVTVKNNSDSAITLDTFTATITFEE